MSKLTGKLRKAAILIASLDQRSADALLDQMPPEQAARVRSALVELDDAIDEQERQTILREFLQNRGGPGESQGGVELDPELQKKLSAAARSAASSTANMSAVAAATRAAATPEAKLASHSPAAPKAANFGFLEQASPRELARVLQSEHPQIVAVVLAHVAPGLAAAILSGLPAELRAEVLGRVADLEGADPEILCELEGQLQRALQYTIPQRARSRPGLGAARAILAALEDSTRSELLVHLAQDHADLVERAEMAAAVAPTVTGPAPRADSAVFSTASPQTAPLQQEARLAAPLPCEHRDELALDLAEQQPADEVQIAGEEADAPSYEYTPLEFRDVLQFADADLARLLRLAEPQLTLLALAGAPPEFVERILRQVPARDAKRFRQRFHQLGPLRLSDVEQAQEQLALIATELVERGVLRLPPQRGFLAAA